MSEPNAPPPPSDPDLIPRHTTPTWEVELLISGVAVFAMLQLPGWLDDRYFALAPRFDHTWMSLLQSMYLYLKSAAILLALTFTLHLSLRAHWIALVGLHSVFPDGVRWNRLRMGPAQRESTEARLGSATDAIERADNRATVVFAMGVMVGSMLVLISLVVGTVSALIAALQMLWHAQHDVLMVFMTLGALVMVPFMIASIYDRRGSGPSWRQRALLSLYKWLGRSDQATRLQQQWSSPLPPRSPRKQRILMRIFNGYARIGIGRGTYAWVLLTSRIGERRMVLLVWTIVFPVLILGSLSAIMLKSPTVIGNYGLFPDLANGGRAINAAYYDDQRDAARSRAKPFIQSAIVTDPYVKLVVPYQPKRDTDALQRLCAPALATRDAQARAESTLDCLGSLHAVTLDGAPLKNLRYEAGSDARNQQPALVAMIDVRALPAGRHQLTVQRAPSPPGHKDDDEDARKPYVIPFWR